MNYHCEKESFQKVLQVPVFTTRLACTIYHLETWELILLFTEATTVIAS